MLSVSALSMLTHKPKIDEISLELLQQYYEKFLERYYYVFELDNGVVVNLEFEKKHLCHLLGIEKMAKGTVKHKELYKYFGVEGYNNIQNGLITIKHLKNLNKGRFNFIKDKLIFFYLLPQVVSSPEILLDFITEKNDTFIKAKLLAYLSTEEAYVHLGIDEDEKTTRFFPKTYFIERINETNDGSKFIKGRSPFKVVKAKKINKSLSNSSVDPAS
ncbi:PBECR4 domain-containing protein [Paenibacillus fonticola]|uniref:PBECR4 domain-containing protein n=1 Tax=Paenibacillus fonticola TaxID=379896 RepID=UPI000365A339|nr:PBECR4 domain-containing protein [Paenibacillus fonticola]